MGCCTGWAMGWGTGWAMGWGAGWAMGWGMGCTPLAILTAAGTGWITPAPLGE